jgi:AmmeMemoRadiSam system protein B
MSPDLEFPRLRVGLTADADPADPRHLLLWDSRRLTGSPRPVRVRRADLNWLQLCTGRRTVHELHAEAVRHHGPHPLGEFTALLERLDAALLFDGERFRTFLAAPDREPACAGPLGCYPDDTEKLRALLRGLFTAPGGPGLPGEPSASDGPPLRATLVPHMDYGRGGVTYAWGFKELAERADASLFVVVGTSHYSGHRFSLTRKNYRTPFGTVPTDQAFVDRLVNHYGDGLFDDPHAHLPEHSIELEVVLMQYLYENRRPFRILPLLVGSFGDCVARGIDPAGRRDIGRMVEALRKAEAEAGETVCYVISGDLAHVGPKFGDDEPVGEPFLSRSRSQDDAIVAAAETADPLKYFGVIATEGDQRRICGLPPTYTVLASARPERGRLLHYGRYVHPHGYESVSFASMGFYGSRG